MNATVKYELYLTTRAPHNRTAKEYNAAIQQAITEAIFNLAKTDRPSILGVAIGTGQNMGKTGLIVETTPVSTIPV